MPPALELPEIEILRRESERDMVGRKVKSVDLGALKAFPGHRTKKSISDLLEGEKVESVDRRGLDILIHLSNEHTMFVRLGAQGSIHRVPSKTAAIDGTLITVTFTQGGDLRIADPETTSDIRVVPTDALDEVFAEGPELGHDLLVNPISWVDFGRTVLATNQPLKVMLLDQTVFVGVGDIYADEILFDSGLRHDRITSELSIQEIRRLHRSIVQMFHDAIKYGGTSLETRPFADVNGNVGNFGEHLAVYGKAGQLSPRSRLPIKKAQFKGRPVFYCDTQV